MEEIYKEFGCVGAPSMYEITKMIYLLIPDEWWVCRPHGG